MMASMQQPSSSNSSMYTHHEEQSEQQQQLQSTCPPPATLTASTLPNYQSTPDGDIALVVEESSHHGSAANSNDHQQQHGGSKKTKRRGHRSRNLSDLFLDAATLTDHNSKHEEGEGRGPRNNHNNYSSSTQQQQPSLFQQLNDELDGKAISEEDRKHRRLFSDESLTGVHPSVAHRRLDSVGRVERKIRPKQPQQQQQQRQGLELLSTAAVKTKGKDGLEVGDDADATMNHTNGSNSRPSLGLVSTGSYEQQQNGQEQQQMAAPPPSSYLAAARMNTTTAASTSMDGYAPAVNYPGFASAPPVNQHALLYSTVAAAAASNYPYASMLPPPPPSNSQYPIQRLSSEAAIFTPATSYGDYLRMAAANDAAAAGTTRNVHFWEQQQQQPQYSIQNRGSQTFVTGLAVGDGTKVLQPSIKTTSRAAHHRKLSSFSTALNGMLGADLDNDDDAMMNAPSLNLFGGRHHRVTSSTVSFLQNLNDSSGALDTDDAFLRNLQASNDELQAAYRESQAQSQQVQEEQYQQKKQVTSDMPKASILVMDAPPRQSTPSPPATVASATSPSVTLVHQQPSPGLRSIAPPLPTVKEGPTRVAGLSYADVAASSSVVIPEHGRIQFCGIIERKSEGGSVNAEHSLDGSEEYTDGEGNNLNGSGSRLAAGGTSKRLRRKCQMGNCENRVVQGGLCIAHGAKRKQCKHPGCDKNVKKAGLCSAHGPARKRCDIPGCEKVAVQGGRCIGHGARKKLCMVGDCAKQAIINGMCKRHHDLQTNGNSRGKISSSSAVPLVATSGNGGAGAAGHQRGLSIFQEMSADAVSSLLNEEAAQFYRS
ncbi:hypothetical protein MPSEU_000041000 [Mayamaea pseudoterrestris]|nr:hypothetical protein MPSEU_000041000 [Mayamaea pseudoterrestris]